MYNAAEPSRWEQKCLAEMGVERPRLLGTTICGREGRNLTGLRVADGSMLSRRFRDRICRLSNKI
ncbi:uncharacterized protein LOC119770523 isoform X2 [Culex quinquefasciatus]|uniref:uncharacterized protein LOC119770523 isoform X2 n=1 Tax=Culex quinquefasciatus TaxID=7176 RepID=UPI0018E3D386|nr:uncharacterized protein LOC119770523 isoform X2 [Culex quinquefasciatus]